MSYHLRSVSIFLLIAVALAGVARSEELSYRSYIYNTYEIMLFSYEDGTEFEVSRYDRYEYRTLDKGQHARVSIPNPPPVADVYEVAASQ